MAADALYRLRGYFFFLSLFCFILLSTPRTGHQVERSLAAFTAESRSSPLQAEARGQAPYVLIEQNPLLRHTFNPATRRRFIGARIQLVSNHTATFQCFLLLQSGDVAVNPGPPNGADKQNEKKKPKWKYPCAVCSNPVRSNQKGILCDGCNHWHHIKCIYMDVGTYSNLSSSGDEWFCDDCGFPFNFTDSFFNLSTSGCQPATNQDLSSTIQNKSNHFPKCLVLNARSIRNKVKDLQALLLMDSFDVIAITETWLDSGYADHELQLDGYNIYRKDRANQRGGGVLLAVRTELSCSRRTDLEVNLEMVACEIRPNPTCCVLFAVFYRPPQADMTFLEHYTTFLDNYSRTGLSNLVLTGDFNFPHIDWSTGSCSASDHLTEEFCNILDDNFLTQMNLFPTRNGNILDLVLTNNEPLIAGVSVHPHTFESDHHPMSFILKAKYSKLKNTPRKVYCYKRADFEGLRESLASVPWNSFISRDDINTSLEKFQDLLHTTIDQHIPCMTLRRRSRPPWIDKEVMKLVKKKRILWKRMKISASQDLILKFKEVRKQTKRLIDHKYHLYLKTLSEKLKDNPKQFWTFHSIKSKTRRIPESVSYKGTSTTDRLEKAEMFSQFFRTVYSSRPDVSLPMDDVVNPNLLFECRTTKTEVLNLLANLDTGKATGVDGVPARILKTCAGELSSPLTLLFNTSLEQGKVPELWKRANITPVYKEDGKDNVENYRSISLLSIPGKCLERIVHSHIYSHVSPFLPDWQHGFIKGRSCDTQLVLTHHLWAKSLDEGQQVDVVFLDFAKAFDRVPHDILLQKLCNFGISGSLLSWCRDYLHNRRQRVVINGMSSSWSDIPSGVPQGSILGPLFFVIFISDLADVVSPGNTVALYADDCKTSRIINCMQDHSTFQEDLDNLQDWSCRNLMDFNVKKCKVMRITKKLSPITTDLSLKGTVLEEVKEFRDLGITTNCHLSWNAHIDKIASKANRTLGLIKRTCRGLNDVRTLKTLYCSLVRSQLEYGSIVWSPYTQRNILKLERVQRRATKFIVKSDDPYDIRLCKLKLISLEQRRFLTDVTFLYKALHGYINVDVSSYINLYTDTDHYVLRSNDDGIRLKKNYARTNVFKFSYFNRITESWNSMPKNIRMAPTLSAFKSSVRKFLS